MQKHPFLKILFPFISGITIGLFPALYFEISLTCLTIFLCLTIILSLLFKKIIAYRTRWISGFIISLSLAVTGYYISINNFDNRKADYFARFITKNETTIIGDVKEPILLRNKTVKVLLELKYVITENGLKKASGKTIIFLEKNKISESIIYGDRILVKANFSEISKNNNSEFEYYRYFLNYKNIYHSTFARTDNITIISRNKVNPIYSLSYGIRDKFLNILKQNNIDGKVLAVGSAILFGYRDLLDTETIKEFSGSGVIHTLCVSGLHVGIIYFILYKILSLIPKRKYHNIVVFIIILFFLWLYAFICGLSPSIQRATIMFSIILLGKSMGKTTDTLDSVLISAFILLLINPFYITYISFQLSYGAVIGIVICYPMLYPLWKTNIGILKKIWSLAVVSFTAQIFIFPLIIFYFHYFPLYFLLSNMIVVPLISFIIFSGFVILATNTFTISSIFSVIFIKLIEFINHIAEKTYLLPFSLINNIYINKFQVILIYILVISIIIALNDRNKKAVYISLICLLIFAIALSIKVY